MRSFCCTSQGVSSASTLCCIPLSGSCVVIRNEGHCVDNKRWNAPRVPTILQGADQTIIHLQATRLVGKSWKIGSASTGQLSSDSVAVSAKLQGAPTPRYKFLHSMGDGETMEFDVVKGYIFPELYLSLSILVKPVDYQFSTMSDRFKHGQQRQSRWQHNFKDP